MRHKPVSYHLSVRELHVPYSGQQCLAHSTPLLSIDSDGPFPSFHVQDTFADGYATTYLGRIEHIHHAVGESSTGDVTNATTLYLEA